MTDLPINELKARLLSQAEAEITRDLTEFERIATKYSEPAPELPPIETELRCPQCFASWDLFVPRRLKFTTRFIQCVVCEERFWDDQPDLSAGQAPRTTE